MIKLRRITTRPILSPIQDHEWEGAAVFNCAAVYDRGLFHLLYRGMNRDYSGVGGKFISSIGYAVSTDGFNFLRLDRPVLVGEGEQEGSGVEDPRVTRLGDTYYMFYTAYGARYADDYRISLATSQNLISWKKHGIMLDEPNKDAALLPEKIGGRYVMFHRRPPAIWVAYSEDLKNWTDHRKIMDIRPGWESRKVGIAGPPMKRDDGWLLFYHAVDENWVYRLGVALLDLEDPTKVIARQSEPVLEPELAWEKEGLVPNVVFSCGHVDVGDEYYVYYAGADHHIGVAAVAKKDVKFEREAGEESQLIAV